jgi:hypothetical protein
MSKQTIAIAVGAATLNFNIDDSDVNRFLNEQMPNEKVKTAYNMLSRTVIEDDKAAFKQLALADDGITPRGVVVMQISTLLVSEFGGDLEITVKKPSSSVPASSKTATAN